MSKVYLLDPQDQLEFDAVRAQLRGVRRAAGLAGAAVGLALGRSPEFVSRLECSSRDSPQVSSLQDWARGLGLRLDVWIEGFDRDEWVLPSGPHERFGTEHLLCDQFWELSAQVPPDADDPYLRLWLMAALRAFRRSRGVSAESAAAALGISVKGLWKWEAEALDPVIKRCFLQARACGGRLRLEVLGPTDWLLRR